MALNANQVAGKKFEFDPVAPGTYPSRLVAVIDLGLQPQRPYMGDPRPPARELAVTVELTDEFLNDADGKPDEAKPRWITQTFPFHNLDSEKAKSTKWYKTLDPNSKYGGDWSKLIATPILSTIVNNVGTSGKHKGRIFENIAAIALPREKDSDKYPQLVNKPIVFDLDTPDMPTFNRIPKFLQEKIKSNLEFEGSALQKLLGSQPAAPTEQAKPKAAAETDDRPY